MTSIWPQAHLAFVADDGEGGSVLKLKGRGENTLIEYQCDVAAHIRLASEHLGAAGRMMEKPS